MSMAVSIEKQFDIEEFLFSDQYTKGIGIYDSKNAEE